MATDRVNVLGVGINVVDVPGAVYTILGHAARGESAYVCVANAHLVTECQSDPQLRAVVNEAALVTPDGMPLVWLLRWARGRASRVYGPDLMLATMRAGRQENRRHFLYGATPETLDKLELGLRQRLPGVAIAGRFAPPFRPLTAEEDRTVIASIERSGAEIVWVGLGAPKQERWMAQHLASFPGKVLVGVGAAFDFHAGTVRQAPPALQRCGLEWAFRLAMEPRRLWRRYLRTNPAFVAHVFAQKTGLRRYELPMLPGDGSTAHP